MKKKLIAALLIGTMSAGLLSGCGSSNGTSKENSDSTSASSSSTEETGSASSALESAEPAETVSLPLTDEKVTLTMYMPMDSTFGVYSKDYNDSEFFKELEKRTNVHIDFVTPAEGEETNSFNLMFTSGELPDIITMANGYTNGGLTGGIEDGYYLDLTDLIPEYMPNYNAVRTSSERLIKDTTMDDGRLGGVYEIRVGTEGPWMGYQVNQNWLDELGLDTPVTYDDWEEMLTAFKEKKGAYAPLALTSYGYDCFDILSAGFGAAHTFLNMDGTVVYSPITDNWKEYLTLMNDWYSKGLIDPDFMTRGLFCSDTELITSEQTGCWVSMVKLASAYDAANSNINTVAIPNPVKADGDTTHIRVPDSIATSNMIAISADCENTELALKWLDYLYTEEGSMLASYGVEGESYTKDENGTVAFTDLINANPDGYDQNTSMLIYALVPSKLTSYYHFDREYLNMRDKDIESYDIWGQDWEKDDWVMPGFVTLTPDETSEYSVIYNDVSSYMNECTLKFITGVMDVNGADWDTYVDTIKGMGIDTCVQIQQAALDRYNER